MHRLFELEKDLAIEKAKPRKKLLYFTILETIGVLLFVALAAFAVGFVFGFDWAS